MRGGARASCASTSWRSATRPRRWSCAGRSSVSPAGRRPARWPVSSATSAGPAAAPEPDVPGVRVVALVAAFNEADVIGPVVRDLVDQGIDVHVLDDGSTDGTAEVLAPLVGHGVLAVERLPAAEPPTFSLARLMRRKQALARELAA